ncbi:hypothetical protein [Pseudomonas sp. AKS31]|uniref:hypothetical protein n=1 Tax=Pseudomonas sp. AKS31 TaxID=2949091 RepID=UPI002029FD2C|nr:hypothetical protein [Pseudomonas sp. AKS31]MCL9799831.1 hypothetical protein [Pseudomonas sp. AKS31]
MKVLLLPMVYALLVSGCSWFNDVKQYDGYAVKSVDKDVLNNYVDIKGLLVTTELIPEQCFVSPLDSSWTDTCGAARNSGISALMLASETLCVEHRKTIYGNDAAFNITAGTFTNLFAGASTVATAQTGKTILSALALLSNAERSLVNETIYKQMLITSVDKKIVELREGKAEEIYTSLESKDANAYSVNRALLDFYRFHDSCSFMDGLRVALAEGTNESTSHKLDRLKNNLVLLAREVEVQCKGGADTVVCKETEDRFKALSGNVKTMEAQ